MTTRQSTERVEQLMAEMDATGRDIERRGKVAAQHLRNAAAKQATATDSKTRRVRVRVVGSSAASR
jgi:predicted nucleotide-binding protein